MEIKTVRCGNQANSRKTSSDLSRGNRTSGGDSTLEPVNNQVPVVSRQSQAMHVVIVHALQQARGSLLLQVMRVRRNPVTYSREAYQNNGTLAIFHIGINTQEASQPTMNARWKLASPLERLQRLDGISYKVERVFVAVGLLSTCDKNSARKKASDTLVISVQRSYSGTSRPYLSSDECLLAAGVLLRPQEREQEKRRLYFCSSPTCLGKQVGHPSKSRVNTRRWSRYRYKRIRQALCLRFS